MPMKHAVRLIVAIGITFVGSGCLFLGGGGRLGSPELNDFPSEELTFHLNGPVGPNRAAVIQVLSDNDIRFREEARDPGLYVVTTFVVEPVKKGAKRVQRVAYRIRLTADEENPDCTYANVTWFVQSKGLREEVWGSVPDDAYFQPSSLALLKGLFGQHPCP